MSLPPNLYLIDTSAWARLRQPVVGQRLTSILHEGAAATCLPLDLEDGRSARSFRDAVAIRDLRGRTMTDLPITAAVATRSRIFQLALTQRGHHRAASPVDLMVAAAAAEYAAVVLHYDRDFDLISNIGGPRSEWIVPTGSIP